MVRVQNHHSNKSANGNLGTLRVFDEAGEALEAASVGTYTYSKQGTREQWVYHLGGKQVSVSYFYTPIATNWGSLYKREQGTFGCVLSWEEEHGFYSSSEQAATVERSRNLTLEQALAILEQLLADELAVAA